MCRVPEQTCQLAGTCELAHQPLLLHGCSLWAKASISFGMTGYRLGSLLLAW